MIENLNLIHAPEAGKNPDALEPEDLSAAAILAHQLYRGAVRWYRERCMRESLTKKFVRHTAHIAGQQSAHMARVLEHGNALMRHILIGIPPKERDEGGERVLVRQTREIEFALLMHECAKLNPKSAGGVNPDAHLEETCMDTFMFLEEFRKKRETLAKRVAEMVEVSGSPYSTYAKHTGVRTPKTVEEAIVFAAVNLDAMDFWGARDIVWIRQHPHRQELPEGVRETVGESLAFAKRMRDEAANRVYKLELRKMSETSVALIRRYGAAYWARSVRFFGFAEEEFNERPEATFTDFRACWNEFFRQELNRGNFGWVVSRRSRSATTQES